MTGALPLSAEQILTLIGQHLSSPRTSRLPVLLVAAAYEVAGTHLGEQARALHHHNAADRQTGAVGDVEITLVGADEVLTAYEMKQKAVTQADIDAALAKLAPGRVRHYVFISTETPAAEVVRYARSLYTTYDGLEVVILDCMGFVRHFLHLFYHHRASFLDAYQRLLLAEPDSAVSAALKETWLALRLSTETGATEEV